MIECERCAYKFKKNVCLCPADVYMERFCNWRNRDNNCREYTPKIGLTERLNIIEGNSGIVSEIVLDTTIVALNFISYR